MLSESERFEVVQIKLEALTAFVDILRRAPEASCWTLADAVERVIREGDMEGIEKAFELCDSKFEKK
jgi:hypothetical protein